MTLFSWQDIQNVTPFPRWNNGSVQEIQKDIFCCRLETFDTANGNQISDNISP